ncbi:MAG TPA: discoidin domain-containing protein, partial [bacterium]|nr:discoidin domain-containing protein [bacterium]
MKLALLLLGIAGVTASLASKAATQERAPAVASPPNAPVVIDDFEDKLDWIAQPADGVDLSLHSDDGREGHGMRMDFSFSGGGYAIARKKVALDLPQNYELSFAMRGKSLPNTIEFKLVDETGENVWWHVRREIAIPAEWETMRSKKRHITFAWGPKSGGEIAHVSAIEIVVTAAQGGKGSVWIDDLVLRPLPLPATGPLTAVATASSMRSGQRAHFVLDKSSHTAWSPRDDDVSPWIELDLRGTRELGGLVLQWAPGKHPAKYRVDVQEERGEWRTVREISGGNGGRDPLVLPETDARYVRIAMLPSAGGIALQSIELGPLEWATSRETFFAAEAKKQRRGIYPRSIGGEQSYWTVVGPDSSRQECLLSEDGALEIGRGKASIEPFLFENGRLVTWADVRPTQELEDGALPIPSVEWESQTLRLRVTAFDAGAPGGQSVITRYRIENRSGKERHVKLFLALRPFQVNPPSQTLNLHGGIAPTQQIDFDGRDIEANGERAVICILPPDDFGATAFDGGEIAGDFLAKGELPATMACQDAIEAASAALSREFDLPAKSAREYALAIPLEAASSIPEFASEAEALVWVEQQFQASREAWRQRTWTIAFDLPEPAAAWARALQSQIGFILVNRAGPAIQPGTRSYARSWIRDGTLTSTALLRTGHTKEARDFLEWYAPHQYKDGKIPCVVDARGADP